jgi:Glyoxalase-like domain
MTVRFQIVVDCRDPEPLARFWAAALGYEFEPPPEGFPTWDDYRRDVGVGEEDLGIGEDRIIDPDGTGPRIWFQVVPERKGVKNRLPNRPRRLAALSQCELSHDHGWRQNGQSGSNRALKVTGQRRTFEMNLEPLVVILLSTVGPVVTLVIFYWIIRAGVRAGIEDAWRRRAEAAREAGPWDPAKL